MKRVDYDDRLTQAKALAALVALSLDAALDARERAVLSVPGGTTPGPFLTALAHEPLDWARVMVLLNDERWVPPDHERSNERLLRGTLLTGAAAEALYLPLYHPTKTPELGLPHVERAIAGILPVDVLVLGMGTDCHTASLFPGADRLDEALDPDGKALVLPMRAPGAPEPRITLTLPALLGARETHILLTGEAKQAALETALEDGPERDAPVRAILRRAAPTIHYAP